MSDNPFKILIIEDDPQIRKFLTITLTAHEYNVVTANSAQEGIRLATSVQPDAILLDLGLPDRDGMDVIRAIRAWSKMPILVLSVRHHEEVKIQAFDLGANDYITKPFGTGELLARLRVSLRDALIVEHHDTIIRVGELEIDLLNHRVLMRNERVKLSPKEFNLLILLAKHQGKLLTHKYLMQQLWGNAHTENNQYLRIYIAQLRQKIEKDPVKDQYIINEPSIGYRLEAPLHVNKPNSIT